MKIIYLLLAALLLTTSQLSAQTWDWTHPEPNGNLGQNSEADDAHNVATDATGNVYVLGDFLDTLYLNNVYRATNSGSYLAKYDSTGNLLWYKLIIPTYPKNNYYYYDHSIRATHLTVNANGVFVIGTYYPGNYGYDCSTGIQSGNIISYSIGNYNFNANVNDAGVFVTKFNTNGGVVWNNVVTAGTYCYDNNNDHNYNYSPAGNPYYNPLIISDKNNNIICEFVYYQGESRRTSLNIGSGTIALPSVTAGGFADPILVFKMNNAGNVLWSNYAYNADNIVGGSACNSIITDNNGNVFLYGIARDSCLFGSNIFRTRDHTNGVYSTSTFLAKLSSGGVWQFAKELSSSTQNILSGGIGNPDYMTVDAQNNLYALVSIRSNVVYGLITGDTVPIDKTSTYLVKLNNSGNLIWHKGFGTYDTYANSIHFANNSLYISGGLRNFTAVGYDKPWYFSALTVKPSSADYSGAYEYYVAKANTNGDFQWATSFSSPANILEGFSVKTFKDNIYTSGYYRGGITSLGNLNSTYTGDIGTANLFFGKLKDQYIRVGALTPKQLVPGCTITVPFTSTGLTFSSSNTFTAELSNASGDFTTPTAIGTTTSTGTGSITATIPASLPYGSGYQVRVRSSDTLKTGYNYYAYADTGYKLSLTCPPPSAGFAATNVTGTSATLNWTAVGCAAGYKVQYRVKGTSAWTTKNIATNTPTINLTGLTANTTYQWHVATKCVNNGSTSFSAYSATKLFTTAAAFTAKNTTANGQVMNGTAIQVQPNPATTSAMLLIGGTVKNATVSISDVTGKVLWKTGAVNTNRIMLPVANFAAGIYLVKLVNGGEMKVVKLVKE